MPPKKPSILILSGIIAISLAVLMMVISVFPDWATFDRSRSIGPVDYRLQADFDAVGFDYSMETVGSSGGGDPLGGIGGGIAGNFSRSDRKAYPEVRGEFLDNLGIIYDSYRTKTYQYELKMRSPPQDSDVSWDGVGNPSASLNISIESDLIPWWPESGERTLKVRIKLVEVDLWDQVGESEHETFFVQISSVKVLAKTGYNKETGEYSGEDKELGESKAVLTFDRIGDQRSLDFSIAYPEGTDAAGFYVEVRGNMTDLWGRPELSPLSGKANPINIYPMSNDKLVKGLGIPMALPLMILSSILGIIALVLAIFRGKISLALMIPAGTLSLIAPLWFLIGMNAAVELLSERLVGASEGLSYQAGIFISFTGAAIMLAALGISITSAVIDWKKDKKGSGDTTSISSGPTFKKIDETDDVLNNGGPSTFRKIGP